MKNKYYFLKITVMKFDYESFLNFTVLFVNNFFKKIYNY